MAKRVNSRFLVGMVAAVVVMVGVFFIAQLALRKNAAGYMREGDAKFARGDFKGAADSYARAHGRDAQNVEVLNKLGEAFNALAGRDPENLLRARGAWNEAAIINPHYVPALRHLADTYWDQVQIAPTSTDVYRFVRESQKRLLDALPQDPSSASDRVTAEARLNLGTLAPWLRMNAPVYKDDINNAVAALDKLAPQDPTNAEIPAAIALAYIKWANEAGANLQDDKKAELLSKSIDRVRAMVKGQENNPSMQLAAYQLFTAQVALLPENNEKSKADLKQEAAAALDAAVKAAKPSEDIFVDVMITYASKLASEGKPAADIQAIYQDMLVKRHNDPRVRLASAKAMAVDRTRRDDAIKLYAEPLPNNSERGAKALRNRDWEIRMLIELVSLRMEKFREAKDGDAKAVISAAIRSDFQRLQTLLPSEAVPFLKLKARYQLLEGDVISAIQLYDKAVKLSGTPNSIDDYDLRSELAQAYLHARPPQTAAAQRLLEEVAKKFPEHTPTQLLLASIALEDNDLDRAETYANNLQLLMAKDDADQAAKTGQSGHVSISPQVLNLRAEILSKRGVDNAKIDEFIRSLPEKDREQRLIKAQIAGTTLGRVPEATRLLKINVDNDLMDMASLEGLIRAYLVEKKNDEARLAVAKAAEFSRQQVEKAKAAQAKSPTTKPGDPETEEQKTLKKAVEDQETLARAVSDLDDLLRQQKLNPQEQYEAAVARVKKEQSGRPVQLAIALGDLARRYQHPEEAEKLYKEAEQEAEKSKTESYGATQKLYALLMENKRYAEAKPYLAKLVRANADGREGNADEARYALITGDLETATRKASTLTVRWPEFGESWLLLGQAQQAAGKFNEAVNQYDAARKRQGKNPEAVRGLIECYYAIGHPTDAKKVISEARQLFPNEQYFRELELGHEVTYGDPESAIPIREKAYQDAPDDKPKLLVLVEAYGRAGLIKYANDPVKRNYYLSKARKTMEGAVKHWPDDSKMVGGLADVLMAAGDVPAGEKALLDYANSDAGQKGYQAQVMLATYYMRASNRGDDAVKAMRAALEKAKGDSGETEVRRMLIAMLAQQRKYDEALAELDKAPKDEPLFVRQRVEVLLTAARRDEAAKVIQSAMTEMPQIQSELRILLVTLYIDSNNLPGARNELEKELAANPNNPAAYYYRAMTKLRDGKPDLPGAMSDLQKVRQIDPNNIPSRLLMAEAHENTGSRQEAITELEEALRLAPLNSEVRRRLVDMYARRGEYNDVLRLTQEAEATPAIDSDPIWPLAASRALSMQSPPDFVGAKAAMGRAIKRAPTAGNAEYFRELCGLLHKAGNDRELLALTDDLLARNRTDFWIYQHRGMAKATMKDIPGALAEFDRALAQADSALNDRQAEVVIEAMANSLGRDTALDKARSRGDKDLRWRAVMASLYQMTPPDWQSAIKQADAVIDMLDKAPRSGPGAPDPKLRLTALRIAAGVYHFSKPRPQIDRARDTYLKILETNPGDYFALNNLAVLLAEDAIPPNPQAAQEYSQKAYDMVRHNPTMVTRVVDTHAWVLTLNNKVDEALPLLRSVVENEPFPEARFHLAEAFIRKGRGEEAEQQLSAAAEDLKKNANSPDPQADQKLLRRVEDALTRARALRNEAVAQ